MTTLRKDFPKRKGGEVGIVRCRRGNLRRSLKNTKVVRSQLTMLPESQRYASLLAQKKEKLPGDQQCELPTEWG